jgi:hypothetical protein
MSEIKVPTDQLVSTGEQIRKRGSVLAEAAGNIAAIAGAASGSTGHPDSDEALRSALMNLGRGASLHAEAHNAIAAGLNNAASGYTGMDASNAARLGG